MECGHPINNPGAFSENGFMIVKMGKSLAL